MTTTEDKTAASTRPVAREGTIQVWSDLLCPFTHVTMDRLWRRREELGLADAVRFEHRAFPLELFNGPHPRRGTDTEAVGIGQVAPEAGFRVWTAPDDQYPHTVLLAAEAVHAANAQGLAAGELLDRALRRAFWAGSRSISHRGVILEVAAEAAAGSPAAGLDPGALAGALDCGKHRAELMADYAVAKTDQVSTSPHLFLADGSGAANPAITAHWEGPWAAGYPVVDNYDPSVCDGLLRRAAG
jgi:predicted DsbA family dithiol-disulfide isomerase